MDIGAVAIDELERLAYAYIDEHTGFDTSFYGAYNLLKVSVLNAAEGSSMSEDQVVPWVDSIFEDWSTHLTDDGEFSSDYDVLLPGEGVSASPQGSTTVVTTVPAEAPVVAAPPSVAVPEPVPAPYVAPEVDPAPVEVAKPLESAPVVVAKPVVPQPVVVSSPVVSAPVPVAAPLYVTEDMRKEFQGKAEAMLTAPWMKANESSLMVSALSQLTVYKSVDGALRWFREYLDTLQRVGIAHGDIDPVTLDDPAKAVKKRDSKKGVAEVKPAPRSIDKLLDRSWIGKGMKRVYRSLYQTYLSEDPEGAYDRLGALLDALERAGRAHGDIGGALMFGAAADTAPADSASDAPANVTAADIAAIMGTVNVSLKNVDSSVSSLFVDAMFKRLQSVVSEHKYSVDQLRDYAGYVADDYYLSYVSAMGDNPTAKPADFAPPIPTDFGDVDEVLKKVADDKAAAASSGNVSVDVSGVVNVPEALKGITEADINVMTEDELVAKTLAIMPPGVTSETVLRNQVKADNKEGNDGLAPLRDYLISMLGDAASGVADPYAAFRKSVIDETDLDKLKADALRALEIAHTTYGDDYAKFVGPDITEAFINGLNDPNLVKVVISQVMPDASFFTSGGTAMSYRDVQQKNYMSSRMAGQPALNPKLAHNRAAPVSLWADFDKKAKQMMDVPWLRGVTHSDRRQKIEDEIKRLATMNGNSSFITPMKESWYLRKVRNMVEQMRTGYSAEESVARVDKDLANVHKSWMTDTLMGKLREAVEAEARRAGYAHGLGKLHAMLRTWDSEYARNGFIEGANG